MTDYYQIAQKLAASLPEFNGNVPSTAWNVLINRLKGAIPGVHSQAWPKPSGPSFREIFFPNYSPTNYEDQVSNITGLDNNWWSDFSVATLCQIMYYVTSNLRSQLVISKINGVVDDKNNSLWAIAYKWYGYILSQVHLHYQEAIQQAPDLNQLATTYANHLDSDAWVLAKTTQYEQGNWQNQEWELVNHCIILVELGQTIESINELINNLKGRGLPIPPSVDAGQWMNYAGWPGWRGWINCETMRADATNGILEKVCTSYPGSSYPSCMDEENSFEFTAGSQPGEQYRSVPSSSCFTAQTKVLMADGNVKAIAEVKVGEKVRTPKGMATVNIVATPPRAGRRLFCINNLDFGFTETHPWMTYSAMAHQLPPLFAVAQPIALMESVPYFSAWGITNLTANTLELAGFSIEQGLNATKVENLTDYLTTEEENILYDLIVEMDADGVSEYIIGDGQHFFIVSSEVPRIKTDPLASFVIATMLTNSWEKLHNIIASTNEEQYTKALFHGLYVISSSLIAHSIETVQKNKLQAVNINMALLNSPKAALQDLTQSFMDLSPQNGAEYNQAMGYAFEILIRLFGEEIKGAIALGWRRFINLSEHDAEILAISVHHLELFGTEAIPQNETFKISLTLKQDSDIQTNKLNYNIVQSIHNYYYTFNDVLYFDYSSVNSSEEIKQTAILDICFTLVSQEISLAFGGKAHFPRTLEGSYRRVSVAILNTSQKMVGRLFLDIRLFTSEIMMQELSIKDTWTINDSQNLAQGIAAIAPNLINQNFPQIIKNIPDDHKK